MLPPEPSSSSGTGFRLTGLIGNGSRLVAVSPWAVAQTGVWSLPAE